MCLNQIIVNLKSHTFNYSNESNVFEIIDLKSMILFFYLSIHTLKYSLKIYIIPIKIQI